MKEYDIRPKKIFDEYLAISKADIPLYFSDSNNFVKVSCPACDNSDTKNSFIKNGFQYDECPNCETLFVSPRPTSEMINLFYRESESSRYWAEKFFPLTAEARMDAIFRPRAKMISNLVEKYNIPSPKIIADVGAGIGLFLDAVNETGCFDKLVGIEPGKELAAVSRSRGYEIIEKTVEAVNPNELQASLITSFEVFEHLFDPKNFVESKAKLLQKGGILLFTTLTISGLDLQVLWEQSKSISPPHHINFVSVEGFEILMKRCGLEVLEITTPGKLDVDIIRNMLSEDSSIRLPKFVQTLLKRIDQEQDDKLVDELQNILSEHKLSSHVCVVARKL